MRGRDRSAGGRPGLLTICPVGGLGNRLRALDSALALARRAGRPLAVLWKRDSDVNAPFRELFEPIPGACVVEIAAVREWAARALGAGVNLRPARDQYDRVLSPSDVDRLTAGGWDFGRLTRYRSPLVITGSRFHPSPRPFADFRPAAALGPAIRRCTGRFGRRTVGVHVRRTDNGPAAAGSPTAGFLARMRRELGRMPTTTFFVATDSGDEEARLRTAFPGRVLSHRPKCLDRASPQAARDAVVDLYCLARTRQVLGSYWSSFSETAAAIGRIPLRVVGAPQDP